MVGVVSREPSTAWREADILTGVVREVLLAEMHERTLCAHLNERRMVE